MKIIINTFLAACLLGLSVHASASLIFSDSASVTVVDRSATFDSLTTSGIDFLADYSEDSLSIIDPDVSDSFVGFSFFAPGDGRETSFWHPSGGERTHYAKIVGVDDAVFTAIDFLLGTSQEGDVTNLRWETYLNEERTGFGSVLDIVKGSTVGWFDARGFDELRVAAGSSSLTPGFTDSLQFIAIDDLRAQLSVPEPASLVLMGLGIFGFGISRMSKQS